jgi:hypothetical protein
MRAVRNEGVLAITELMRLTRIELCDLAARITNAWPDFPEGSESAAKRAHQSTQHSPHPAAAHAFAGLARRVRRCWRLIS